MKRKQLTALLLVLLLLFTGCGAEEYQEEEVPWYAEEPENLPDSSREQLPKTFSLAVHRSQTLDPVECSEGTQQYVGSLLYEPMFALMRVLCLRMCFVSDRRSARMALPTVSTSDKGSASVMDLCWRREMW